MKPRRIMLDTNILDRLAADPDAASELDNRRDLTLLVTAVQLSELAAIPDAARRGILLGLATNLCKTLAPAAVDPGQPHAGDRSILLATAARCDLLVSDDRGLLEDARRRGVRATDWDGFLRRVVFAPR